MTRIIPTCPSAPTTLPVTTVRREYAVTVVTPLFGGGAKAGHVDPQMPIRGSSIRGHLRFWWRYKFASTFGSAAAMRARESEVWGNPDSPSPVQLTVEVDRRTLQYREFGNPKEPYGFREFGPEMYALFSAKQQKPPIPRLIREGLRFKLTLRWPTVEVLQRRRDADNAGRRKAHQPLLPEAVADITADVDQAAMAWLRFGGIGSRTRRGVGAVHPDEPSGSSLPTGTRLVRGAVGTDRPMDAWRLALTVYQDFRQKAYRNPPPPGEKRPGRSFWPEPDTLRGLTGCTLAKHATPTVPVATLPSFPKAALGLPIVVKFADGPDDRRDPRRDPCRLLTVFAHTAADHDGQPTGDRMASPVVIRPVWKPDIAQWVPGFLFLPRPEARQVAAYIGAGPATPDGRAIPIPNEQIVGQHLGSLDPMNGRDCAIDALFDFAYEELGRHQRQQPEVLQW